MEQLMNKRSTKNYKRNSEPATKINTEYIVIQQGCIIIGNFKTLTECKKNLKENCEIFRIETYKLNNKKLTIKQKEN